MMLKKSFFIFLITFCVITSAKTEYCIKAYSGKEESHNSTRTVRISGCSSLPCQLRAGTRVEVVQTFVPIKNLTYLATSVVAKMRFIDLPFWGIDGEDASTDIYTENGNRATWPLMAGTDYVYKKQFPVKEQYPRWNLIVRWKLVEDDEDITCFEVRVKITD